jgi:hypothetical protein
MTLAALSLAAGIVFFILMLTRHDARRQLFKGLTIVFALLTIGLFEFFLRTDAQLPQACGTANVHLSSAECDKAASDAQGIAGAGLLVAVVIGAGLSFPSFPRFRRETRTAAHVSAPPAPPPRFPPPGWYEDPYGHARLRYWDGARWTDSTSDYQPPSAPS